MKNSIQSYLKLPFIQKNEQPSLLSVTVDDEEYNVISDNYRDMTFNTEPNFTKFYFLSHKDFIYHQYESILPEDDREDDLILYMVEKYEYHERDKNDCIFVKHVCFDEYTNYVCSINHKKHDFETVILENESADKLFFITRNKKNMVCDKVISLNVSDISSIEFIKSRKDIWDNGFISLFCHLEVFGTDDYFYNKDALINFYNKLCVSDTITL